MVNDLSEILKMGLFESVDSAEDVIIEVVDMIFAVEFVANMVVLGLKVFVGPKLE